MQPHKHTYISGSIGDECKYCGLLKSTIEAMQPKIKVNNMICENCNEKQEEIDGLLQEIQDLKDEIKTLETELGRIDKWHAAYPR